MTPGLSACSSQRLTHCCLQVRAHSSGGHQSSCLRTAHRIQYLFSKSTELRENKEPEPGCSISGEIITKGDSGNVMSYGSMVTGQAGLSWAQGQQVVTLCETTQTHHRGYKLALQSPSTPSIHCYPSPCKLCCPSHWRALEGTAGWGHTHMGKKGTGA